MDADSIIRHLGLIPHPGEGGYFRETYRSRTVFRREAPGNDYGADRSICTAIYYLLTPDSFSVMHRLRTDEIFHFYLGDPVELLRLAPDGSGEVIVLGNDLTTGHLPQALVPSGCWQGLSLAPGGRVALLGTTVAPGFEFEDFELGERENLRARYPEFSGRIERLSLS